jgi:hypothetical protein
LNASAWSPVFAGLAAAAVCAVWHSVCASEFAPHELMSVSQMNWVMMPDWDPSQRKNKEMTRSG